MKQVFYLLKSFYKKLMANTIKKTGNPIWITRSKFYLFQFK